MVHFRSLPIRSRLAVLAISTALCLAACAPEATPQQAQPTVCPTPEIQVCEFPAELLAENSQPPDSAVCTEKGEITRYENPSELLNGTLALSVYLPPCYDPLKAGGYPVLFLLHGQKYDDRMWINLGAADLADEYMASGEWQPFIMVMPFEEFFYRKAADNQYPVAIVEEVLPWVDETFNTCSERACRALGGISRGASWTVRIGLNDWQQFGALGVHSLPDFLGGPDAVADWLEGIPHDQYPRVYMDSGHLDTEIKIAYHTEQVLNEKGVPHEWHMSEGRHEEAYWQAHIADYMNWYASLWTKAE